MFTIYKKVKSFPTREQAVAELYSMGAVVQGHNDFPGDHVNTDKVIADGYLIKEEAEVSYAKR